MYPTNKTLYTHQTSLNRISKNILRYFILFIAWPSISIGVSITFYIFFYLVSRTKKIIKKNIFSIKGTNIKFYLFWVVALLSLFFAPWEEIESNSFSNYLLLIQYSYWILLAIFFKNTAMFWDRGEVNKFIFWGLVVLFINFFLLNFRISIPFVNIWISRNGFVYTVVALWPFAAYHIYDKYGKFYLNLSLILTVFLMLLTDGRSGAIIILIENIILFTVFSDLGRNFIKLLVFIFLPLLLLVGLSIDIEENRKSLGNFISPYSARIGDFIKGEGLEGDLTLDKSWLTRKLMIEKGFEIINKYPLLGVGVGNFTNYKSPLENLYNVEYQRLTGGVYDEDYYNRKSAHNSYIHTASEMGLLGFVVLLWILLPLIQKGLFLIVQGRINRSNIALVSIIGMCIHYYAITSIPGALTWFVFGIASSIYKEN